MLFYGSFYEAVKDLPNENKIEIYEAIFELGLNFNEKKLEGISGSMWHLIKPLILTNIKNYKNGNKPKLSETEATLKRNRSDIEAKPKARSKEKGIRNKEKGIRNKDKGERNKELGIRINEVKEYFKEKGYSEVSAEKFFEYYDTANWRDSKGNKVLNWKQKAQSVWFKPENEIQKQVKQSEYSNSQW